MLVEFNGKKPQVAPDAFVAPTAVLIGDVVVGSKSSVWWGAVLRGDWNRIQIGERTSIQDNCVVHGSMMGGVSVGSGCTVGHAAVLHNCTVKDGCLVGMNATVLDGSVIGEGSVVSAGSVVTMGTQVEPGMVVAGVPGKQTKAVSDNLKVAVESGSNAYVDLRQRYLDLKLG